MNPTGPPPTDFADVFSDGMGAAAATSGVLNQLQGRIFGLLYLQEEPLSLDAIAAELQQSKSNVSVQIRGLLEWHLVKRVHVEGSRKDHYVAVTDFWRAMLEIMERRFRWNMRQVIAAADETERALDAAPGASRQRKQTEFARERLARIKGFFSAVDAGIGAFAEGRAFAPDTVKGALRLVASKKR